ncbi:helix-turn-helix domain-containing protein [Candidatus Bipolaricaulota bacterium]|nr:helix-turn-helix domain-containing protein [Candidatus Bipolaricaulota bacterium]
MKKADSTQPCEGAIWYILPYIRAGLARELSKLECTQREIAEMLGLTQAAVSQYKSGKRGKIEELDETTQYLIEDLAFEVYNREVSDLQERICTICKHISDDPELLRQCGVEEPGLSSKSSNC